MRPHNQGEDMEIALTCWCIVTSIIGSFMVGWAVCWGLTALWTACWTEGDVSPFYLDE